MPTLLFQLASLERLTGRAEELPLPMARAVREDLEYARFGAALPELPLYQGVRGALRGLVPFAEQGRFYTLFHTAPVRMGLKLAELVAMGALVGKEPGLAVLTGYFHHVCVDRALNPVIQQVLAAHRHPGEALEAARRRVEWVHTLLYMRELYGSELLGTSALRSRLQILKRQGLPTRGIGRGLYELVRVSSQETFDLAPTKSQIDGWVRGLYAYGAVLASPLARLRAVKADRMSLPLYKSSTVDVWSTAEGAQVRARELLTRLMQLIEKGAFTPKTRDRFLQEFPDGPLGMAAA